MALPLTQSAKFPPSGPPHADPAVGGSSGSVLEELLELPVEVCGAGSVADAPAVVGSVPPA